MTAVLAWAEGRAPDRLVALATAAVRPLRYVAEGLVAVPPPVESLVIEVVGVERAGWHGGTGLYGFLRLPPGAHRVLVRHRDGRTLPAAFTLEAPDRSAVRARLEAGVTEPLMAPPALIREVGLRPAPTAPLAPGVTAVHGLVRDAADGGRPVALARLAFNVFRAGALRTVVTYSAADGAYILPLPDERPDTIGGDPPWAAARNLGVRAPTAGLRAALREDFLAALPAELDTISIGAAYTARDFTLSGGLTGTNPPISIQGGRQLRHDVLLD